MTKGVSLVELMVILGIMAIVSGAAFLSIPGLISRNALNSATENLVAYLRDTRQKSISQEQGGKWGIHFEGIAGDADWYEIFYGADYVSGTKAGRVALSPNLKFLDPTEGSSKDVIFSKLTGATASTSIRISLISNESVFSTINISSVGMISYAKSQ